MKTDIKNTKNYCVSFCHTSTSIIKRICTLRLRPLKFVVFFLLINKKVVKILEDKDNRKSLRKLAEILTLERLAQHFQDFLISYENKMVTAVLAKPLSIYP